MAFRISWTPDAKHQLRVAILLLKGKSPEGAARFREEVRTSTSLLRDFPERGRIVPGLDQDDLREVFVGNYRLIYRVKEKELEMVLLFHMSRDPDDLAEMSEVWRL